MTANVYHKRCTVISLPGFGQGDGYASLFIINFCVIIVPNLIQQVDRLCVPGITTADIVTGEDTAVNLVRQYRLFSIQGWNSSREYR